MIDFAVKPDKLIPTNYGDIPVFINHGINKNEDEQVVKDFGNEWKKFKDFDPEELKKIGDDYFDILKQIENINNNSIVLDVGCGSGRWSKVISRQVRAVEAIDPSDAVMSAIYLLRNDQNVRVSQASIDTIPFSDNTFDLAMSIGVLHHVPDTEAALKQIVKKIKPGGYFYGYLYYNFENRSKLFKSLFLIADLIRRITSRLPTFLKKTVCDLIAIIFYMPFVLLAKVIKFFIPGTSYQKIPLSYYTDKSLYIIRNDALDRFGTKLEKRYSRQDISNLIHKCGLENIVFSNKEPYWHFLAKKHV